MLEEECVLLAEVERELVEVVERELVDDPEEREFEVVEPEVETDELLRRCSACLAK